MGDSIPAAIVPVRHEERDDDNPPVVAAPSLVDDLTLAARAIERGDQTAAIPHLHAYLTSHPEHVMIRAYLAELLWKLNRYAESRQSFDQFIAEAQERDGPVRNHLIHCHTRLMEMARTRNDAYTEHLHRGIGLYLLTEMKRSTGQSPDPALIEQLLCRATMELNKANESKPNQARSNWYLYEVWTKLDQTQPAAIALRIARSSVQGNVTNSDITPSEQRGLLLAASLHQRMH